ncbi:hypothetical protein N0V93_002840 [Gnomoniopsis smithogilvyi]|uniref:Uncharacterized protein n=1 Tax=Gnomoniopsis smithogilvyi TaxID=1191159 RepID=A0A9W9CZB5_9PEZI|nr:hypothetical protein N0V93_002840 [Gnomoniopsis smithogilvyi]
MPALFPSVSLPGTPNQVINGSDISSLLSSPTNDTIQHFDVICAWPVSGQYGPGTRFLYYVLVAVCVLGRGSEWLKGACLAAALLVPAVAALHGIVLAAVHVDGAVDMDVYGAFQICAIGVLAGPATVKISQTYFNTPGRNLIFLWTGMVLSGLLSLTVEFFRATTVSCPANEFSWGEDGCGITCSPDHGPASPLRGGSQNNIYVIKAPELLSFGTATLLSAACCIPAILSLVSMWNMILKRNWTERFGDSQEETGALDEPIPGTNSTPAKLNRVNSRIRFYLKMVEIPVFGAAVLAILIVGERNFFDYRVSYMTEPIASVGQWAPIVGTGLAAMGSLYALLAADGEGMDESTCAEISHHCNCPHHPNNDGRSVKIPPQAHIEDRNNTNGSNHGGRSMGRRQTYESSTMPSPTRQMTRTTTRRTSDQGASPRGTFTTLGTVANAEGGSRRKVARAFELIGDKLGTPAPDTFDDSEFLTGRAADFPTVPAEEQRNAELPQIMASYNPPRDSEGHATPNLALRKQRSRGESFTGSTVSGLGIERLGETATEVHRTDTEAGHSRLSGEEKRPRRDTLEVPTPTYLQSPIPPKEPSFGLASGSPGPDDRDQDPSSPTIRISHESVQ